MVANKVDLNRAGREEIERGLNVTPELADRIVRYRDEHGRFENVDELNAVFGDLRPLSDELRQRIVV